MSMREFEYLMQSLGITRRNFLKIGSAFGIGLICIQVREGNCTDTFSLEWEVAADEAYDIRRSLNWGEESVQIENEPSDTKAAPLVILVGIIAVADLAGVLRKLLQENEGGTILDYGKGKLRIRHDEKLPPDSVVIIQPYGKIEYVKGEATKWDVAKWIEILLSVIKK